MPRKRTQMETIREVIKLHAKAGMGYRPISEICKISKTSVGEYVTLFRRSGLSYEQIKDMDDPSIMDILLQKPSHEKERYEKLSSYFDYFRKELSRKGVTLELLWHEYNERHPDGYSYSRFCHHFQMWDKSQQVSMHMEHKAGEKMFIDFTGTKMEIVDKCTGEIKEVEVFISILGSSQYIYVEVVESQQKEIFLKVTEDALHFYEGVPQVIVPDCLKSAVTKSDKFEPGLNELYHDFARHYQTVIIPARPKHPKDKSLVENAVRLFYQRILARLRNRMFFSIEELNEAIWQLLEELNNRKLSKRDKSRKELFEQIEKEALQKLPIEKYQLKEFAQAKVQYNHHVYFKADKHYYSVPYEYTGKTVKICYTPYELEFYYQNRRIAFHQRDYRNYKYTTKQEHRPDSHRFKSEWNAERFISWAVKNGPNLKEFIEKLLESKEHPEQAYNACMGVLSLKKRYDKEKMEKAAVKAIYFNQISYRFLNNILKNNRLEIQKEPQQVKLPFHGNIRGKEIYK